MTQWEQHAADLTEENAAALSEQAAAHFRAAPEHWPDLAPFVAALKKIPGHGWPLYQALLASTEIKPRFAALNALTKWKRQFLTPDMRALIVPILADMRHQASRGLAADLLDRIPRASSLPDGAVLMHLPNGLRILRRIRHEPIDFDALTHAQIVERTDKRSKGFDGSKFLPAWNIDRLMLWIAQQITILGWPSNTYSQKHPITMPEKIGVVRGNLVYTIMLVRNGRDVHAYPIED